MYDKLNIVIPSRVPISEKYDFVENLKETSECDIFVFWIENPVGESLSVLYNDILDSEHINGNIIVFMHDDVEILKKGWGKEILRLFNEHKDYGIIGVAGSGQFDEECTWWNYPERYGQKVKNGLQLILNYLRKIYKKYVLLTEFLWLLINQELKNILMKMLKVVYCMIMNFVLLII